MLLRYTVIYASTILFTILYTFYLFSFFNFSFKYHTYCTSYIELKLFGEPTQFLLELLFQLWARSSEHTLVMHSLYSYSLFRQLFCPLTTSTYFMLETYFKLQTFQLFALIYACFFLFTIFYTFLTFKLLNFFLLSL